MYRLIRDSSLISQSSLSRSMKKLEEEFGVSLFHRENSKIALNETGKVAAEYARRALDANQEMIDRVIMFDRSLRTVNLGSCAPFPINALMPTLQERLPGKTLSTELQDSDERLIQNSMDALMELIDASNLPFFYSDQMLKTGYEMPGRISLSITDDDARATFWIACLASEQQKYRSLFSAIRGTMLRGQG